MKINESKRHLSTETSRSPEDATPVLSVIVVGWNTREYLAKCLASVQRAGEESSPNLEILVVDNASSDGSAEMVKQQFPQVRLMQNRDNLGFARANNQALAQSRGDYILLLNPDTELESGALSELFGFLEQHPDAGAVGARLVNPDRTLQLSCHPGPGLFREFWRLFHLDKFWPLAVYPMEKWDVKQPRVVETLQGACLMIRRRAIEEVGNLDEEYFIYSEEVDLCRRLRARGWKLWWVPEATVVHHGGQSTRQVQAEMFLRLYQGKILYFRKHFGLWKSRFYKAILAAAALARQVLIPLALFRTGDQRRHDLVLARHYRALLQALPRL